MGTGFTIDSPLHVARYGISSVISLVDDVMIEQVRKYHSERLGLDYTPIGNDEEDARARRITAYLDMLDDEITKQVDELRSSPFEDGSEITRYYELLPECGLKDKYREFLSCSDESVKADLEQELRHLVRPGTIDVNIMTKLDRFPYRNGKKADMLGSDAVTALRGYARSKVSSSIVFSAGLNAHLYGYMPEFEDFFPNDKGESKKHVVLKVSDYRSAIIQGRFLAKRGIWVSEFRVESGLNCGGHAFASKGFLLGPILEEFRDKRDELVELLHRDYNKGLAKRSYPMLDEPRKMLVSVQGGIGTAREHSALLDYYNLDHTGWATPFLLVPEATCVDDLHLERLCQAGEDDVYMGNGSPMGIQFWTLRNSESEIVRRRHIADGTPGSACPKGFLKLDTELTERPVCRAARNYQKMKLAALDQDESLSAETREALREDVLSRACICHDLAGGATLKYGIDPDAHTAVCPSGNIAYFSKLMSLDEMVGHIYGRISLLKDVDRPHMFVREIDLYIEHLRSELKRFALGIRTRKINYYVEFKENLLHGIDYYENQFKKFVHENQERFVEEMQALKLRVEAIDVESFA
jgi:hypothetical protein